MARIQLPLLVTPDGRIAWLAMQLAYRIKVHELRRHGSDHEAPTDRLPCLPEPTSDEVPVLPAIRLRAPRARRPRSRAVRGGDGLLQARLVRAAFRIRLMDDQLAALARRSEVQGRRLAIALGA